MATAGIRCGPNVIRNISLNSDGVHIFAKCVNNMLILPYPCIGRYQSYHLPQTELWTVLSPWRFPWCSAPSIFDFCHLCASWLPAFAFCRLHHLRHNFYLFSALLTLWFCLFLLRAGPNSCCQCPLNIIGQFLGIFPILFAQKTRPDCVATLSLLVASDISRDLIDHTSCPCWCRRYAVAHHFWCVPSLLMCSHHASSPFDGSVGIMPSAVYHFSLFVPRSTFDRGWQGSLLLLITSSPHFPAIRFLHELFAKSPFLLVSRKLSYPQQLGKSFFFFCPLFCD